MHRIQPPLTSATVSFALAFTLVASASLSGCAKTGAPAPAAPRTVLVSTALPNTATAPEFIGEVRSKQRAELSFAVPGVVHQVLVQPGDHVRQGQLLAILDAAPGQALLRAANADTQRLQANLDEARRKHERLASAHARQSASDAERTAAETELRIAEAALATATAQRDNSAWQRAQTELRAPFDGVVAVRQLEVGQAVGAGAPVIHVDGAGRELWVNLPAGIPWAAGQSARLVTDRGLIDSRLLRLGSRTEAGGARRGVMSVPDGWQVGETLSVRILSEGAAKGSVQVPLRAVVGGAGSELSDSVYRLKSDGKTVERVSIRLGDTHGDAVEVLSGLNAGDQVVVAGGHSLTHGATVKPVTDLR